jgi:hypothetical protein
MLILTVNVNAADSQGWTAVHHLVCPLDYGTFDNEEMLFVLAKVAADIQKKDNAYKLISDFYLLIN